MKNHDISIRQRDGDMFQETDMVHSMDPVPDMELVNMPQFKWFTNNIGVDPAVFL
jgi:hypothetical protein